MKEFFYGYKAKDGEVGVVVCVVADDDLEFCARGVAVRSYDDPPDWDKGAFEAKRRAVRAFKGREWEKIRDDRAIRRVLECDCPWTEHSDPNPRLSFLELRRLCGRRWRERIGWAER